MVPLDVFLSKAPSLSIQMVYDEIAGKEKRSAKQLFSNQQLLEGVARPLQFKTGSYGWGIGGKVVKVSRIPYSSIYLL